MTNCCSELEERGDSGSCIFTISNIFTDDQCKFVHDFITVNYSLFSERVTTYGSGNNVECKFLVLNDLIKSNLINSKEVDELIFKGLSIILPKLSVLRPEFNGTVDDGYVLRKIFGGTSRHMDGVHSKTAGFKQFVRCLSIIVVLNDDYDGGIFNFPNQGLKFKVKKGEAVLFPPYWTHPHYVTSVGEGQARYTINTWILEKFID